MTNRHELPCGIVEDLLPSYVDGLTGEESTEAVRAHLEDCGACREKYQAMSAAEERAAQIDAPVVDAFAAWNRRTLIQILLAVAALAALVIGAASLRTYVWGTPVHDYELEWRVWRHGGVVDIDVMPSDNRFTLIDGDWKFEEESDGSTAYRFTGKKVRKSFLNRGSGGYGYSTNVLDGVRFYVDNTLVWADGLEISGESCSLYYSCTPYVGDPSALNSVASALGIYEEVGMYDNELQTAAEPYGWTLHFESYGSSNLNREEMTRMNRKMRGKAVQLLAAVGNLGYVSWTYTDEDDVLHTETVTLEEANALLPTLAARYNQRYGADWTARDSVKDYADSPESLEELRQLLELRD